MRRGQALCLALALAGASVPACAEAPPAASAVAPAAPGVPALADAVGKLVRTIAGYGGQVGVAIVDADSGALLAGANEARPMNPASNAKILTAAAALATLRPSHRFQTSLHGKVKNGAAGTIVLRGHGDPSLATRDLWDMVRDLRDAGVRRVEGDILVDQRFFDDRHVPPAFEQQPNEWAYFHP